MKKKVVRKHNNSGNCFVCGINNPWGLKARFYELEDGTVAALGHGPVGAPELSAESARRRHNRAAGRDPGPRDKRHGAGHLGRHGRHQRPLQKAVPYDEQLLVTGRVTRNTRLIFESEGALYLKDGTLAATSHARYMKQPLDVIGDLESNGDIWVCIEEPDDPALR